MFSRKSWKFGLLEMERKVKADFPVTNIGDWKVNADFPITSILKHLMLHGNCLAEIAYFTCQVHMTDDDKNRPGQILCCVTQCVYLLLTVKLFSQFNITMVQLTIITIMAFIIAKLQ